MAVYEKVCKALNEKRKGDESLLDFSLRAAKKANGLDNDDDWKELGDNIQRWAVAVLTAKEAAGKDETPEIPGLDGWPGGKTEAEAADEGANEEADEETSDDEAGDEEAEQDEDTASEEATEESVDESADSGQEEASEAEPEEDASAPTGKKNKKKGGKVVKTPAKSQKSKEKSNGKGKDKEMTTTKAAKSTKTPASQNARIRIDQKGTIKVLVKENPHREKTKNHVSFSKYKDGMTVEAALKAKIPPKNIYYEVKIGNIKVVPAKKSAAA